MELARNIKETKNIDAPFVVVKTDDGNEHIFAYEKFLKEGAKMFSKKDQDEIRQRILVKKVDEVKQVRKTKTKKSTVKKDEVISTNIEEE